MNGLRILIEKYKNELKTTTHRLIDENMNTERMSQLEGVRAKLIAIIQDLEALAEDSKWDEFPSITVIQDAELTIKIGISRPLDKLSRDEDIAHDPA